MCGQVLLSDQVLALPGRAVDDRDPVRGRPGLHPAGEPAREPHQVRVVQVIVGAAVRPPGSGPRAPGVRCLPSCCTPRRRLTVAGAVSGSPLVPARWTGPDGPQAVQIMHIRRYHRGWRSSAARRPDEVNASSRSFLRGPDGPCEGSTWTSPAAGCRCTRRSTRRSPAGPWPGLARPGRTHASWCVLRRITRGSGGRK
jgi:hypothetical protein